MAQMAQMQMAQMGYGAMGGMGAYGMPGMGGMAGMAGMPGMGGMDVNEQEVAAQLQNFIQINNLDDSCQGWLRGLTVAQQKAVMEQGLVINVDPARGSANSVVMGRIKKAKQGTLGPPPGVSAGGMIPPQMMGGTEKLRKFIEVNRLDASAASRLMTLNTTEADWVMDQGFVIGSDPTRGTDSAVAMGRVKKVKQPDVQSELLYYPTQAALQRRTEDFIQINNLDGDCATELRQLSPDLLAQAMGDDFLLNQGDNAGVVMGRIKRARDGGSYGEGAPDAKRARWS
jgi:hypothetical protein